MGTDTVAPPIYEAGIEVDRGVVEVAGSARSGRVRIVIASDGRSFADIAVETSAALSPSDARELAGALRRAADTVEGVVS